MRQQQRGMQFEPSMKHGPISGPINGSLTAVLLTVLIWMGNRIGQGVPVWLPIVFAFGGCLTAAVVTFVLDARSPDGREGSIGNLVFRCCCWLTGGVWSHGMLTWIGNELVGILFLIFGTVVGVILVPVFTRKDEDPDEQAAAVQAEAAAGPPADVDPMEFWLGRYATSLLSMRKGETVTFTKVPDPTTSNGNWANDSGATFLASFSPGSSKGLPDIEAICEGLQRSLALPDGCIVSADRSGIQGQVLVNVMFFNDMGTTISYPRDYAPRSGIDDFSIGVNGNKTCQMINLLQDSLVLQGSRGEGKTVTMHSITASMLQCRDVVVWHVDLNSGKMSYPWLRPKAKGEIDGYPIDWVASTPQEALEMAIAARNIALARPMEYAGLTMDDDKDVLPISAQVPMLLIMVDETGEMAGTSAHPDAQAATNIFLEVQRLGRSVCVNVLFSTQRSTQEYMPSQIKKLSKIMISVRVADDAELAYLFDWKKLKADDLLYPGCAYVKVANMKGRSKATGVHMMKAYLLLPAQIREIVLTVMPWRPQLDDPSRRAAGKGYETRWERPETVAIMNMLAGNGGANIESVQRSSTALLERPTPAFNVSQLDAGLDALDAELRGNVMPTSTGGDQPTAQPATGDQAEIVAKFMGELDQLYVAEPVRPRDQVQQQPPSPQTPPAASVTPAAGGKVNPVDWCEQFISEAGPNGRKTEEIVAEAQRLGLIGERRRTVNDWLAKLRTGDSPKILQKTDEQGNQVWGFYVHRRYVG